MESKFQKSLIEANIKKHIACSYGYKLVSIGHKFNGSFKDFIGKDAAHISLIIWLEKVKVILMWWKTNFNKEFVITKQDK